MESQLTKILATTRRGLQERKSTSSTRVLEQAAATHQPRGFARALRQKAANGPAVANYNLAALLHRQGNDEAAAQHFAAAVQADPSFTAARVWAI